jgi:hypothetical protein
MPYIRTARPIQIKMVLNLFGAEYIFSMDQHHKIDMMAKRPICTHLSNQILSSQFSFGKALPGIVSNTVEIINQQTGGTNEGFIFFKPDSFRNIK